MVATSDWSLPGETRLAGTFEEPASDAAPADGAAPVAVPAVAMAPGPRAEAAPAIAPAAAMPVSRTAAAITGPAATLVATSAPRTRMAVPPARTSRKGLFGRSVWRGRVTSTTTSPAPGAAELIDEPLPTGAFCMGPPCLALSAHLSNSFLSGSVSRARPEPDRRPRWEAGEGGEPLLARVRCGMGLFR